MDPFGLILWCVSVTPDKEKVESVRMFFVTPLLIGGETLGRIQGGKLLNIPLLQ